MSQCVFDGPNWTHVRPCAETPSRTPCFRCRENTLPPSAVGGWFDELKRTAADAGSALNREALRLAEESIKNRNHIANEEIQRLCKLGIPLADMEYVTSHPMLGPHMVPFVLHTPTNRRLVSFPTTVYGFDIDRHEQAVAEILKPKPPTLREWLGDHVSELGPWAEVLREQPVPAGYLRRWEWRPGSAGAWYAMPLHYTVVPDTVVGVARGVLRMCKMTDRSSQALLEALQMALFARHPAVKPEPRKPTLRTWFGNEEEP